MKRLVISFIICFFCHFPSVSAQQFSSFNWMQGASTQSNTAFPLTLEEIQQRTTQAKQAPPDKESLLLREMERVDGETANATLQRSQARAWKDVKNYLDQLIGRITKMSANIAAFDCDKDAQRYYDLSTSYQNEYQQLTQFIASNLGMDVSIIDPIRLAVVGTQEIVQVCKVTRDKFKDPAFSNGLQEASNTLSKSTSDTVAINDQLASAYTVYLDALQARRSAIQDKLNATQSVIQIGGSLPLLLFILGTACVSTILGIKLFDKEIQMEWVASGQVIQFVTVMILLSVILALGLSSSLKENTLGTLLGGLAGYVLAQGVGRSAARDALRSAANSEKPLTPSSKPATAAADLLSRSDDVKT